MREKVLWQRKKKLRINYKIELKYSKTWQYDEVRKWRKD
jgi:hypothetical protein